MKSSTVGLVTSGIVIIAGISYIVYYDYQRRKNPTYRKAKRKEKKREVKQTAEAVKGDTLAVIQAVLDQVAQDDYPTLTEEKEAYFMKQVSQGESLVAKGDSYYHDSVLPFYRALKVYPKPLDLIMMYQKTIPDEIFQMIISIMSLEQKKIQNGFYEHFPPKSTSVKLAELPSLELEGDDNQDSLRRGLVADRDIKSGELIYSESPLISTLHPYLEGYYCHFCMKCINTDTKTTCSNCSDIIFCGTECQKQGLKQYHQFMCTNNNFNVADSAQKFKDYCDTYRLKYPQMISRFLSSMVEEEMENKNPDQQQQHYSSWDHMDRMRYFESLATENTVQEIGLIKLVLTNKVPGIDQFLTDDIYLMLKGKLAYNSYPVPGALPNHFAQGIPEKIAAEEQCRQLPSTDDDLTIGTALYRISTYIGQSMDDPNVKIVFKDNNNKLSVVATRDILKDDEITTNYILPS